MIRRIEVLTEKLLHRKDTMMVPGDHQEEDLLGTLKDNDHQKYRMLIGMLNQIFFIGQMDVAFATFSLSRFTVFPRYWHMN